MENGLARSHSVDWQAKCVGGSSDNICDIGGIKGKTTVKTDKNGRGTIYVEPTFYMNESPTNFDNTFSIAFEGEKGSEVAGLKTAKTEKGMKSWGWAATSPCKIDEVFTKCGAEYMKLAGKYGVKVKAFEKEA